MTANIYQRLAVANNKYWSSIERVCFAFVARSKQGRDLGKLWLELLPGPKSRMPVDINCRQSGANCQQKIVINDLCIAPLSVKYTDPENNTYNMAMIEETETVDD